MPRPGSKASPATGRKPRRVYLPHAYEQAPGAVIPLSPEQKRHLITALRHGAGDAVEWFDGGGAHGQGLLTGSERTSFGVELQTREVATIALFPRSTLYLALPKRDDLAQCVELATIAGIGSLEFFAADHSPWRFSVSQVPALLNKLTAIAIEASEQCGRLTVPGLSVDERGHAEFAVTGHLACTASECAAIAHPSATPSATANLHLAIGPEGGWSARELAAFGAAGWTPWHLPGATLTTVAACAILPALWRFQDTEGSQGSDPSAT